MFDQAFLVGQAARLDVLVTNVDGQAIDPSLITLLILSPNGSPSEAPPAEIVKESTGAYHYDLTLNKPGRWYYRWETGAPAIGAAEGQINVQPSRFK